MTTVLRPEIARDRARIDRACRAALQCVLRGERPWPVLLVGPAGVGKTCAALCVADRFGRGAVYYTAREFARRMRLADLDRLYSATGYVIPPEKVICEIADASIAILDEIGTIDRVSDHHYNSILDFIESRRGKPAVYISNLDLPRIADCYDDRIASRLGCGTIIRLDGPDRRLQARDEAGAK